MTIPQLDTHLPTAIAGGQVRPHFQPLVDVASGRVVGAEALARWAHPELGDVPPYEFVPVAERLGLIDELGLHMLRSAWAASSRWRLAGHDIGVSVNVSALQLATGALEFAIADLGDSHGIEAGSLTLEITESQLFENIDTAAARLVRLSDMGVVVSIDDFGTSYSSMERVEALPISEIKIDMSMIHDTSVAGDEALRQIAEYAHARSIELVAEGVETEAHLERVRSIGCQRAQGWLFGRPADEATFTASLA